MKRTDGTRGELFLRRESRGIAEDLGATLIELLGYFFVLAIIVNLATGVFVQSSRLSALGVQTLESMRALQSIQGAFAQAVRASNGVAAEVGRFRSGPSTLVLRMAGGGADTGAREFIVFGTFGGERIQRWHVRMEDGAEHVEGITSYPLVVADVRFVYDSPYPETSRLITMQIQPKQAALKKRDSQPNTMSAAPRLREGIFP
ncbi:MAG: hypothetical protein AMXMBFR4_31720 [Candidatus Hydrogenedentota bacterium]